MYYMCISVIYSITEMFVVHWNGKMEKHHPSLHKVPVHKKQSRYYTIEYGESLQQKQYQQNYHIFNQN